MTKINFFVFFFFFFYIWRKEEVKKWKFGWLCGNMIKVKNYKYFNILINLINEKSLKFKHSIWPFFFIFLFHSKIVTLRNLFWHQLNNLFFPQFWWRRKFYFFLTKNNQKYANNLYIVSKTSVRWLKEKRRLGLY